MMSVCFIVCCNIDSSDRCCCKIPSDSWTGITKCATKYWYQSFSLQKPWPFWIGLWVSSENQESDWSSAEVFFFGSERYGFVWKLPCHLLLDNTCSSKKKWGKYPPILIVQFTLNRLPFWEGKWWWSPLDSRDTQIEIWYPDASLCSCKKRDANQNLPTTFSDAKDAYWKPNMLCLMKSYVYLFTVTICSSHPKYGGVMSFPWNQTNFAHEIFDSKPNMMFQVPMIFQSSSIYPLVN